MTNREFFKAVIEANVNEELSEYAKTALEHLDAANSKRRDAVAKKNAEKAESMKPIVEAILACLTDNAMTSTDILEATGADITPQKVSVLLRPYIEDGTVIKTKVKAEKGTKVGYIKA